MRRLLALTMLQRGLSVAVYVVASMIIARLLTPAQVGVFSLAAAFLSVCSVIREFGITEFLMQDRQLDRDRIRAAYGVAIVVGWALGLLILVLRHPIAAFYGEPGVADVLAVLCLTFVFLPFATPTTALIYRDLGIGKVLWIQTVALIAGHVASVALAFAGLGYMALAWSTVVNSVCMVGLLLWSRRDALGYAPTLRGAAPVWSYCSKYTLSGALEQVGTNLHEFIIGRRFGFASLGLYSRANGLFVQFNQNVTRGISRVLLPNFAKHAREESGELREQYLQTLRLYTGLVWPMYALVAVLAPEIIRIMFGPQWAGSVPLLRLLCVGAIVQAGYAFASELLGAMGQAGARLRISSISAPLWAVLCVLASFVSLQAIAAATAVRSAIVLWLYARQLRRLVGLPAGELLRAMAPSLGLAVAVLAICWPLGSYLRGQTGLVLVVALAVGALAVAVWLAAAFALRHPVAKEIRVARGALRGFLSGRRPASH